MAGWPKLAFLAIVAVLVCLPAGAQVQRVSVPEDVERVEWSAGGVGWDVAVSYDPETCEVYCIYRRTRDVLGQMPLLPPVTTVRFHAGPAAPATVLIDPAGVASPALLSGAPPILDDCCTISKRLAFPPVESHPVAQGKAPRRLMPLCLGRPAEPILALRI